MKDQQNKPAKNDQQNNAASKLFADKSADPEHKRTRKPGSQSNSSKQHNNGRGGGK